MYWLDSVNFIQVRVSQEERTSTETMSTYDWPAGKPVDNFYD